ncbi:hypothetical protein NLG97_g10675 [Lecanicillium saksenae]|uniref:Uncharacterized protein n=1 Tax=Lecanicillium saksenae TaxID=468837 RepID=A0ACC1QEH1_9HYPO|nr:hypothetical protein NLG97_g10675 [Lecanicillium saksenae]
MANAYPGHLRSSLVPSESPKMAHEKLDDGFQAAEPSPDATNNNSSSSLALDDEEVGVEDVAEEEEAAKRSKQ